MQVTRCSRGFHTPDTCQITIKTIISGKTNAFFLFAIVNNTICRSESEKNMELHLFGWQRGTVIPDQKRWKAYTPNDLSHLLLFILVNLQEGGH